VKAKAFIKTPIGSLKVVPQADRKAIIARTIRVNAKALKILADR